MIPPVKVLAPPNTTVPEPSLVNVRGVLALLAMVELMVRVLPPPMIATNSSGSCEPVVRLPPVIVPLPAVPVTRTPPEPSVKVCPLAIVTVCAPEVLKRSELIVTLAGSDPLNDTLLVMLSLVDQLLGLSL